MSFLSDSLYLTAWGMGLVFLVLAGLWAVIALLARAEADEAAAAAPVQAANWKAGLDPRLLAAIVIAVRAHVRVRRKQAAPAMRAHAPGSLPSRWTSIGRGRQVRGG
jgi:Na+-transporting methylmalonyl-CoA/oxaloacetate decarboxylase gamma subunit